MLLAHAMELGSLLRFAWGGCTASSAALRLAVRGGRLLPAFLVPCSPSFSSPRTLTGRPAEVTTKRPELSASAPWSAAAERVVAALTVPAASEAAAERRLRLASRFLCRRSPSWRDSRLVCYLSSAT